MAKALASRDGLARGDVELLLNQADGEPSCQRLVDGQPDAALHRVCRSNRVRERAERELEESDIGPGAAVHGDRRLVRRVEELELVVADDHDGIRLELRDVLGERVQTRLARRTVPAESVKARALRVRVTRSGEESVVRDGLAIAIVEIWVRGVAFRERRPAVGADGQERSV